MTGKDDEPESQYDDLLRAVARASERAPGPPSSTLVPGAVIAGKFRIVRPLGEGGMGKVFEIEHELTRHRRALKVLHSGASSDVVARFVREASAAARIGNPHVAETFDAGRLETGEPYLLMELLEGETLEARAARVGGRVDPGELATLVHQACEGMQAAHDAGIIHRDLKPDNLFIERRDGQPFVKILDFGISKFDETRTGAPGLTRDGSMMGTPYYMSPEQVRGLGPVDARTDVYALGVILYECACGQRPFDAAAVEHLAVLIHRGQATPLDQRLALPPGFSAVVARAMATEVQDRFQSARDLAAALAPFRTRVILSQPAPRTNTDPAPPLGAGAAPRAAFAATLRTDPAPAAGPSRARVALVALALAAGVAGSVAVWAVLRPHDASPDRSRADPSSSLPTVSGEPAPSAVLAPPPPAIPVTVLPVTAVTPTLIDASATSPARPAAPRNRADQRGLAGENPFR